MKSFVTNLNNEVQPCVIQEEIDKHVHEIPSTQKSASCMKYQISSWKMLIILMQLRGKMNNSQRNMQWKEIFQYCMGNVKNGMRSSIVSREYPSNANIKKFI